MRLPTRQPDRSIVEFMRIQSAAKPDARLTRRGFLGQLAGVTAAMGLSVAVPPARAAQAAGAGRGADLERVYHEGQDIFANPERGFYAQRRSDRMERLDELRGRGISLLLVTFDLRDFRDRELSDGKLDELRGALGTARTNGFKVIFRSAYGFTGQDYRVDPTDLARITGHIRQIGAVLTEERDVLCGIQAGMLGPWGEWHGSNHGNPPSLEARRAVLFGWLDAVPAPIPVSVRRPMFIRDIFAAEPGGNELDAGNAFSGSRLSRTGWHNDAFLARPSDLGTYAERGWDRERELQWCSRHGRFTPFGGETVHSDNPMPIEAVVREMELLHATYLNIGYHPRVLDLWRQSELRGGNAFEHIARRLGYRFVAERLRCARGLRAGGRFPFAFQMRNVGFASPLLPRLVEVAVLDRERASVVSAELPAVDPRHWGPEAGTVTLQGELSLPANITRGTYQLGLRLADPAPRLRPNGRYAIRLANDDIEFAAAQGWNVLAADLVAG